jgi:hypothetical protein
MAEGLVIPISTPGGDQAAATLGRVANALGDVGEASTSSADHLAKIGASASRSEEHLAAMKVTGNAALQELGQKGAEFARSLGGAGGAAAEVGVKILATIGPYGAMASAAVGAIGMIVNAYKEQEAKQERVRANTVIIAEANARLGGSYGTVIAGINAANTADEARLLLTRELTTVLQQRLALEGRGYDPTSSLEEIRNIGTLADALVRRENITRESALEIVASTIATGNATQQNHLFGTSIEHSTVAAIEQRREVELTKRVLVSQTEATMRAAIESRARAIQGVAAARAESQAHNGGVASSILLQARQEQLTRARVALTSATHAHSVAEQQLAVASRDSAAATAEAASTAAALAAAEATRAAAARAAAARAAAASSAPSEQEIRSQAEGLRMAREANDNAMLGSNVEMVVAQARAHLDFTTRELTHAEADRHHHTRRVTAALQEQTQAQGAYRAALEAESAAVVEAETARGVEIASQRALIVTQRDAAAAAVIATAAAAAQARQAESRGLAMRRASEDAVAANAAENALSPAEITSGISPRATLLAAEEVATRELARATVDLASARREEGDASIPSEERTGRMTAALSAQTGALQRQRAAQRAVNAETEKIKTDRVDALTGAAKGLGDGLVSAGLAAAFAGENIGAALQKQLAASLQALAIESAQKALFALATGFFQLATYQAPAAAASFTSAAIFGAVAVGAGLASAAIAPSAAPAAAGGGADERASSVSPGGAGGMGGGSGAGPIVNNYYAPIVGGRQSTDAETGVRIDRYNDAARARLRRAA